MCFCLVRLPFPSLLSGSFPLSVCKYGCDLNSEKFQGDHLPVLFHFRKAKAKRQHRKPLIFFYNIHKYKFILQVSREKIVQVEKSLLKLLILHSFQTIERLLHCQNTSTECLKRQRETTVQLSHSETSYLSIGATYIYCYLFLCLMC